MSFIVVFHNLPLGWQSFPQIPEKAWFTSLNKARVIVVTWNLLGGAVKHPNKEPRPHMLSRVRVFAALAALLALVLAGCQSGESTDPTPEAPTTSQTTPTVAPSPTCTDPPGPCSEYDYKQEQLFEEAKARYMEYLKLYFAVNEAGGASPAPAWLDEYTAEGIKDSLSKGFVDFLKDNVKAEPGAFKKLKYTIRRLKARPSDGADVALRVCLDARGVNAIDKDSGQVVRPGIAVEDKLYFKRIDGKLKIFKGSSEKVEACDVG